VLDSQGTLGAQAFRQLLFGLSRNIVAVNLSFVAGLAEVSVPPAEPLGNRAAELAFELNVVTAMLRAVLNACADVHS
jgi:hypothetical protein